MSLANVDFTIDRTTPVRLVDQISGSLRDAIVKGRIGPGARLPSWLDMATHLGVARGTVKAAYERLADESLVVPSGASGTRVAQTIARPPVASQRTAVRPLPEFIRGYNLAPLPFQLGVPAQDAFPAKLWSRIRTKAVREEPTAQARHADPRGNPALRAQIASYLAIARGMRCEPDQIILTSGYRNGLCLAIHALNVQGRSAWMEDPGYPITRKGLELSNMKVVAVPVDAQGVRVARGIELAPDAAVAIVTPGQQAPTGVSLAPERRRALLAWASEANAWIVEDDYLSDLQLSGRAAPALAADDFEGRVIYIGSFGKTLSPALGLGFVVVPLALTDRFGEVAACLFPAPNPTTQLALTSFIADGYYLRHLRQMKQLYSQRRDALLACLGRDHGTVAMSGLALMLRLPADTDDVSVAREALQRGIAPDPLSVWSSHPKNAAPGFLLSVTNLRDGQVARSCSILKTLLADHGIGPTDIHQSSGSPPRTHRAPADADANRHRYPDTSGSAL
jgi:GntR family transcriptional regulator/MocR family aminotransferase